MSKHKCTFMLFASSFNCLFNNCKFSHAFSPININLRIEINNFLCFNYTMKIKNFQVVFMMPSGEYGNRTHLQSRSTAYQTPSQQIRSRHVPTVHYPKVTYLAGRCFCQFSHGSKSLCFNYNLKIKNFQVIFTRTIQII